MTEILFSVLVALIAVQRLLEVRLSARNERALRAEGAAEAAAGQMPWMRALHAGWLVAMPLEVFFFDRPLVPWLAAVGLVGLGAGQALRYAAIRTLGRRWTVKVLVLPEAPPVARGLYAKIRHPNYLGVMLEILFVPLVHTAWATALAFSALNAVLLRARIRAEEDALRGAGGYAPLEGRGRFIPR